MSAISASSGAEVDFIVETDTGPYPVEVKFGAAPKTEPIAMRNFKSLYSAARPGLIVSRDTLAIPSRLGNDGPLVIPAFLIDFFSFK